MSKFPTVTKTILLTVFTPAFPTGSVDVPPFDGSRLVAAAWLLASLVFMSSYGGILTAMITVPRVTIPIDSLSDLVAQDELPWKLEYSSMTYQYFQVNVCLLKDGRDTGGGGDK